MLTATVLIHFVNFACVLTANIYHRFNIVRVDMVEKNVGKCIIGGGGGGGAGVKKRKSNAETAKIKSK